jgi:hypothetical protein
VESKKGERAKKEGGKILKEKGQKDERTRKREKDK